jgi:hypothetical protein
MKVIQLLSLSILFTVTLIQCKIISNQKKIVVKIENIKVYNSFIERGYTTASAYKHFNDMIAEKVTQFNLSKEDTKKIEEILNNAEQKKHYQIKFGGGLIFIEFQFNDSIAQALSRAVISLGSDRAIITNLTGMKNFIVTNPSDITWLIDFKKRIRNQY